ncbi:MAG TPA: hypothetical protein V6D10_01450 [Trichocoleus sp.]
MTDRHERWQIRQFSTNFGKSAYGVLRGEASTDDRPSELRIYTPDTFD